MKKTLVNEYVYKISSRYIQKRLTFVILNIESLLRYSNGVWHFSYFQFVQLGSNTVLNIYRAIFAFCLEIGPKNLYRTTQIKNLHYDLFDLVISDDLNLLYGPQMPRTTVKSMPDPKYAVLSSLFQLVTAFLPGEASDERK